MLSGKVRWREVALFALFALVPAASLAVLGFSAVGSAEGAAQREVAAMVSAAAERVQRTADGSLRDAEDALAKGPAISADPSEIEADLRNVAPPIADVFAIGPDGALLLPRPPVARPAVRDPACDDEAAKLAAATDDAARRESRRRILRACSEARTASGRMLWPLVAIDALRDGAGDMRRDGGGDAPHDAGGGGDARRDGAGDVGALEAWIEAHAADLSPIERRATQLDVEALTAVAPPERARIAAALASPQSRRDDLARELATPEARSALDRAQRSPEVATWRSATSVGAVRALRSGVAAGYVVHAGSLADAVAQQRLAVPPDLHAEVASSAQAPRAAASRVAVPVPVAAVEIAPSLFLRLVPVDPGIVARQAKRSRLLLGGVGVGSTLFACVLAALLYRRMRAVERSSDLRTDFVSTVSHELRTPIASVRMLAELLEEGRVAPDEHAEVFEALAREARRLGETVDRLLGFSRMAAGRYVVDRRRANVAAAVAASIAAFEERNPETPRIERDLDASLEADIDAGQIQLAVDNLLANAKKYAPGGAPYGVRVARDGAGTLISVKDSGPGVARRDQKRIFAPFERADDRLSRATEGSGIGLSLVAHVAKAHGGRAWVESTPGQGATFHLWIESPLQ